MFSLVAPATCVRCFCCISCNTFKRSRSRWLNAIRSVSIGPSAIHESGHFYFAQTGHSHFAATSVQGTVDKSFLQVSEAAEIRIVCAWLTNRRLGIVFQEEVHPLAKSQTFTSANHLQNVVIPRL